jgi:hypothetical protein
MAITLTPILLRNTKTKRYFLIAIDNWCYIFMVALFISYNVAKNHYSLIGTAFSSIIFLIALKFVQKMDKQNRQDKKRSTTHGEKGQELNYWKKRCLILYRRSIALLKISALVKEISFLLWSYRNFYN